MDNGKHQPLMGHVFEPKSYIDRAYQSLIDHMLKERLLQPIEAQMALMEYEVSQEPIGFILVRNGFIRHEDYIRTVLSHNPETIMHEEMHSDRVDEITMIRIKTMLVAETRDTIYLATLSAEQRVRETLEHYYPDKTIAFVKTSFERVTAYLDNLKNIAYGDENALEKIIRRAIREKASDIHLQPGDNFYTMFFRVFGVKRPEEAGDLESYKSLVAKVKVRSNIDVANKRTPHDGGFSVRTNGRNIDLRVATMPLDNGHEQVVIRLLDPAQLQPDMDKLGISGLDEWKKGVSRANGLALICGPTGSGKTTTLNASITSMDRFGKAITSVEDPVEYRIAYVSQVNVNRAVGLDFAQATRANMRNDPDVLVIGEIRDEETARNAIKGAETGHLILGTMHTQSILSAADRLRDIGVSQYELRDILRTVLVQSLVRTLCPSCQGEGCPACHGQGYNGRTVVSECKYFKDSSEVDAMLKGEVSWTTIVQNAVTKMMEGVTDQREIIRVFGEEGIDEMRRRGLMQETLDG